MKPLKLTMTAFGPYKERETIDFSELQGHRLFVVSGNTGAGKTTIFDAICFALYGEASGEDRSDKSMLRSHFADDQTHTSVDFIFELKGRKYRVFRQLPHVKAGNKNATGDRYELVEVLTDGREVPLADRFTVKQVDQKIQELVGLDRDQFSQIVMLPQGEFRKLLTSETENKEEILRRIFKTGLYKIVADHLNEKRKQMQQICAELAGIREVHMNGVKSSLAGREGSELQLVFRQEHYNVFQVLEALDKEIAYYAEQMKMQKLLLQDEVAKFQENTAAYHQAVGLNEQFDGLDGKVARKRQLEDQEEAMKANSNRLSLAEQAVHLQVHEKQCQDFEDELDRKTKLLEEAKLALFRAEAALQRAQKQYELEEGKAAQREEAVRALERLQQYLPTVREMDEKQRQIAALRLEAEALAKQLEQAAAELELRHSERLKTAADIKGLEESVAHLPELTEQVAQLREQARVVKEVMQLIQKAEQEQQAETNLKEAYELAEHAYSDMEIRWIEGQAGILASHLHDGEACPVCGSIEHPRKAGLSGTIPSKEELEQLRSVKSAAEKKYLACKATLEATRGQMQEKTPQLAAFGFRLGNLPNEYDGLVEKGTALAAQEKSLKEDQAKLSPLKKRLEEQESKLEALRKEKDRLTAELHQKKEAYTAGQALYDQAVAGLPEDVRSLEKLLSAIHAAQEHKKLLETVWKEAQDRYQEGKTRHVKAAADLEHAELQVKEASNNKNKAFQSFAEALKKAGFQSADDYRTAKMTDSARAALKQQIDEYYASLASVSKQIEELSAALAGKQRQDLAMLEQRLKAQEQRVDSIRNSYLQAESSHEKGTEAKANIVEADRLWQDAEREHQLVKDLYDVVRGENQRKTSFERYLQIEFLEKIIHAANLRLRTISNGQYYLVRSGRLEKRGKQSGLGFDVYDNYTGQLRDVKTLSGGEKFNASLCLALGMSDVIQSYEGGIVLETMFIDEGFGSLDEESLNKAIDTLMDLQQSGRMIGVISHVQELKMAVPAVLEVRKTKEGHSYTNFLVS